MPLDGNTHRTCWSLRQWRVQKFIKDLLLIFTFKSMLSDEKDIRHQKRTAASLLPRALPLEKITIRIFEKCNERIFEYSNIRAELYFYPHIYFMVSSTCVLFPRFLYLIGNNFFEPGLGLHVVRLTYGIRESCALPVRSVEIRQITEIFLHVQQPPYVLYGRSTAWKSCTTFLRVSYDLLKKSLGQPAFQLWPMLWRQLGH